MNKKIKIIMANACNAVGVHEGMLTKRSKTGDLKAHRLVCFDGDGQYIKICPKEEIPWGISQYNAEMKEDLVCIQPLSSCAKTAKIHIDSEVKAGQFLCISDDGKAKALPSEAGTYCIVGLALEDGYKDNTIEALTSLPRNIKIN